MGRGVFALCRLRTDLRSTRRPPFGSPRQFTMKVTLSDIPTLRQLYKLRQIIPADASALKYKASGSLLDRVSL